MVIIGQQESQFLKIKFKILWKLEIGKQKKKKKIIQIEATKNGIAKVRKAKCKASSPCSKVASVQWE